MKRAGAVLLPAIALAICAVVALGYWTQAGSGSSTASTAGFSAAAISVPSSAFNTVTVTWTQQASLQPSSALNSSITYAVERKLGAGAWTAVSTGGCSGAKPHGTTSCADTLAVAGSYSYRVLATYNSWTAISNETGPVSVTLDAAAPTNAITLSSVTGNAYKSGATVYYRGLAPGSFTLTNALTDSGSSGPASTATAALSGVSLGWTHSPSLVSLPAGGPYVSNTFSWSAFTTSAPTETVTGSDAAGNTAATALTFTNDSAAPTGGTVDATGLGGTGGRYSTSTALSIAFTAGTDAGSGVAPTGAGLFRATAPLGDGSCGTYGAYALIGGADPASPAADTVPADHSCYRYAYVVYDRVANQAVYVSPDIKVDTAAAHPDFLQPVTSPETARAGPAGLTTGDIDNDGDQDVVTANLFENSVSVLINNGVGSFREMALVANAGTIDVGLGKFDNDSNLDLVMLYPGTPPASGILVIFKGGGDGTFTYMGAANSLVNTGVRPTSLAVGQFNADAIDDVAVVNSQNNASTDVGTVTTYLGNPAGNDAFAAATPAQTLSAQIGATDIAWADFNGGSKDLVITNYASNSITFLGGNGTGFDAPTNIAAGVSVYRLDTANLNAGTNRDIVATVGNSNPSAVRILFGDGAGAFPTQTTTAAATAGTGATPQAVVAKDFDGDGDPDIAVANASPSTISVLANNGAGAFTIAPASPEVGVGGATAYPWGLASADFDGNGYDDLAATTLFTSPGEVRVLLNQNGNRANLSITQTDSPDPVTAGQDLTYALTVSNAGASTPSSVKVTDDLPTGVTFNAAASSATCSAAGTSPVTVTCDYGSVAPGTPETQQIVVSTNTTTPASLSNTATVAGNLADATPADNASTATTTVVDLTGPTGGSVDATGLVGTGLRYSTSTTLSLALAKGTDPSGLAPTGAQLRRSTATLTSNGTANGSCGSYSASVQIGANDPVSPVADVVPASQACYRYEYVVKDTLGNSTTYTSPDIKIDTTAPGAPPLAVSAATNAYLSGATVYYRSTATSGGFTVTASATDDKSGIASYTFPTLPSGWTATPGAFGIISYSWSAASPTPPSGVQNTTATNHAGLTSAATGATITSDTTAPAGGNASYTDGYFTSLAVPVTLTVGTDGGSGVNAASGVLQRAEATLTTATQACGSYGAFATVTGGTNPSSPFTDTSVVNGKCYQYRYLISDRVGNQATYTGAGVAKVDTTAPAAPTAASVTSGGPVWTTPACSGVTSGTRYINNAGMASVGVSTTIATPDTGDTVVFSATTPGSTPVTATVAAGGTTVTTNLNLTTLLDGTVTLTARRKDAAGNLSATLAPANPIIKDIVSAVPTGLSYNDRTLVADQIQGSAECGATIIAVKSGGSTYTSSPLTATGPFTLNVAIQALLAYSYNVTATDRAGNVSAIVVVSGTAFL